MSALQIPCPKCGKALRLRDRSSLGKKGKCPACQHAFVLEEPEEVQLELADVGAPAVGTAAMWVPDGAPASSAQSRALAVQSAAPAGSPFAIAEDDIAARRKAQQRRQAKRRNVGIGVAAVVGLIGAGAGYAIYTSGAANKPPAKAGPDVDEAYQDQKAAARAIAEQAESASPTQGKPIELLMVPSGASVVINLRVGDLWQQGSQGEEFRYCLGEALGAFVEGKIKELCLFEPAEVDSVLFCLMYRAPGEAPDVCGVVHLKAEAKKSEFVGRFKGEPNRDLGYPIYKGPQYAYLIAPEDPKTFAFCPASMASEMVDALKSPNPTVPGIEELLRSTDSDRHATVVFRPDDARVHQRAIVPENMLPFWTLFLDWFNPDEVEAVAWSIHLAEKKFHSDILLRNKAVTTPPRLQRDLRKKLDALPAELMGAVEKMSPKEMGKKQLIGRLPAMMQVFSVETGAGVSDRYVHLTTTLPERAAPNLALGGLLAWDESTRTDFTKSKTQGKPSTAPATGTGNETIVAKLNKKIEIDFRKTPLQEAIAYIGTETGVTTEIDGEGLKFSGYTKNMAQDMKLGQVPAIDALKEILKKYKGKSNERDDMCIIIEEDKKLLTLSTKGGAEKLGKKPYDIGK